MTTMSRCKVTTLSFCRENSLNRRRMVNAGPTLMLQPCVMAQQLDCILFLPTIPVFQTPLLAVHTQLLLLLLIS